MKLNKLDNYNKLEMCDGFIGGGYSPKNIHKKYEMRNNKLNNQNII